MTNLHFELLPIEINAPHLLDVFRSQLKKGISLTDVVPAIEASLRKIRESAASILEKSAGELESEFIKVKKATNEVLKWLEYLITIRKEILSTEILPEDENAIIHTIEAELEQLLKQLEPVLEAIVKKREDACKDIGRVLKDTINSMEKETAIRAKKIMLEYEKLGEEKYNQAQLIFNHFFENLKAHSDTIIGFIQPRMSEWNTLALSSGRGFLIDSIPELPCSILFSIQGECYLIFENVGHLLGSGLDKLVFRSICLPRGKIQALIKPLLHKESPDARKQMQFIGMWLETEMLMKLKGEKGIIAINEKMAFEWEGEKKLFLAEEYYWDGNLSDYLKYPIKHKIESAKISSKKQREIISDLLEGLVAIHKNRIVHHDIKPDNILLNLQKTEGAAVIADFHLATYMEDASRIIKIGLVPRWAPPEYAKIEISPDMPFDEMLRERLSITTGKLDIWGMGLIFYALVTYELPSWIQMELDSADPTGDEEVFRTVAALKRGWLPDHLRTSPYFPLLEKMLEPEQKDRCTALEALEILKRCKP